MGKKRRNKLVPDAYKEKATSSIVSLFFNPCPAGGVLHSTYPNARRNTAKRLIFCFFGMRSLEMTGKGSKKMRKSVAMCRT